MAIHDIMPWTAAEGGHEIIVTAQMEDAATIDTADTSWLQGEVLLLDPTTGNVQVIADGIENVTAFHYIAAAGSGGLITHNNLVEGATPMNVMVPMYPLLGPSSGFFYTENVVTSSDTQLTAAQKAAIFVGDTVGLWRDNTAVAGGPNGTFSVNTAGTGLQVFKKLDAQGRDSDISGAACLAFVIGSNV